MPDERPHRKEKIAKLLLREVGRFVKELVDVPDGTLITVSRVVPSANHQHADVFITVFPFDRSEEMLEILKNYVYDIQHELNKELKMRPVPKIRFVKDESEEKARTILDILDEDAQ